MALLLSSESVIVTVIGSSTLLLDFVLLNFLV